MRKRLLTTIAMTLLLALASLPAFAGNKVDVCHLPPGNPANWHTITISENALGAHLGHGDLEGSCAESCETLCDDGNACTQDIESDINQCVCNAAPRPPVDCDDSNPCTFDACDSELGCTYDTSALNGIACDDGDPETTDDVCTDGVCAGTAGPSCTGGCFDCGTNSPCQGGDPNTLFPHCDPQAYIQCNLFFGCRLFDCGQGAEWNQGSLQCVPISGSRSSSCSGCNDCTDNSPCEGAGPNELFPHCDPQAYIQCNSLFGCRFFDCGEGQVWSQADQSCVSAP